MKVQTVYLVDSLKDIKERDVFEFLLFKKEKPSISNELRDLKIL